MSDRVNHDPLVSIIIPVYNGSNYLRHAIDSALAQTYPNIEVLVVNDGSNDKNETEEIALSYGDRIKYFSKPNGGVSSALNYGISKMNGQYFSWLSHDDAYCPQKVEHQIALLKEHNFDKSLVALCEYQFMNSDSEIIGNGKPRFDHAFITWKEALYDVLKNGSYNGCAFLIPRQILIDAGWFDEDLRYLQDTQMWKKIFSCKVNMLYSTLQDVRNRIHSKQLTQTGQSLFNVESSMECNNVLPIITPLSTGEYNFILAYAYRWAHYGNQNLVKKCLENAIGENKPKASDRIKLFFITKFGLIRPAIRKMYYRLCRKV